MRDPEIERCLAELDRIERRKAFWSMSMFFIVGLNLGIAFTMLWKVEPLQRQAVEKGFAERDENGNWRWKQ